VLARSWSMLGAAREACFELHGTGAWCPLAAARAVCCPAPPLRGAGRGLLAGSPTAAVGAKRLIDIVRAAYLCSPPIVIVS